MERKSSIKDSTQLAERRLGHELQTLEAKGISEIDPTTLHSGIGRHGLRNLDDIEDQLSDALQLTQRQVTKSIDGKRHQAHRKVKEIVEDQEQPMEQQEVQERIERLRLFIKFIRNIRMNRNIFNRKNGVQLRINQIRAIDALIEFLEKEGYGSTHGYFKQPTGAGKTVLFGIITRLLDVKTLILVPRINLLEQTKRELTEVVGISEKQIGLIGGNQAELGNKYTIATYQSHLNRMKRDPAYRQEMQSCEVVICDEAHRSLGKSTQKSLKDLNGGSDNPLTEEEEREEEKVLRDLDNSTNRNALKIGFTATPQLANKSVDQAFKHLIAEEKHANLVKAGILVPYKIIQTDGTVTKIDIEGYLNEEKEVEILRRENSYRKLLSKYVEVLQKFRQTKQQHSYPLRGVAFCVRIAECDVFAQVATQMGLRVQVLTSRETKGLSYHDANTMLRDAEDQLLQKDIDLLVTVGKLAEGWDFPPANAAIWARATQSPALIVQGVGRTARSYKDEDGREKECSYVFETDWKIKGVSKKQIPPLCIGDALAENGEDPEQICSMADGRPISINRKYSLQQDGTVEINGRMAVGLNAYADTKPPLSPITLIKLAKEAKLSPVPNIYATSLGTRPVLIYWKDEVDKLIPKRLNERGIVDVGGRLAIGINPYAAAQEPKVDFGTLKNRIMKAKLQAVSDVIVYSGQKQVEVYWKDEVDRLIPKQLNEEGIVDIDGRLAVGLARYAGSLTPSIHKDTLIELVQAARLQSINVLVSSNSKLTDVYWKDEVDRLLPKKVGESGIIEVNGRQAVVPGTYAQTLAIALQKPLTPQALRKWIDEANLRSIPNIWALRGKITVDLYWKDEVDAVLREKERL